MINGVCKGLGMDSFLRNTVMVTTSTAWPTAGYEDVMFRVSTPAKLAAEDLKVTLAAGRTQYMGGAYKVATDDGRWLMLNDAS